MLINISNHPSEKWSAKQCEAARTQFGEIIDFPFPNIAPEMSAHKVYEAADGFFRTITMVAEPSRASIHIMGEMNFTYQLVQLFKRRGFACYASTSERKSIENPDGTKTIQFDFVQFRSY